MSKKIEDLVLNYKIYIFMDWQIRNVNILYEISNDKDYQCQKNKSF